MPISNLYVSDLDFVRIKRPRQQVANKDRRIFRMSDYELQFVERLLTRKPNLQIYRTHQTANMGDFVILDLSDPEELVGWVIELKTAPNSAHAGVQLLRASEAAANFGITLRNYRSITGNIEEVMKVLTRGRGSWK